MPKRLQTLDQKQVMHMTAAMHQGVTVLQMSSLDLAKFATDALAQNPFIEDASVNVDDVKTNNLNIAHHIQTDTIYSADLNYSNSSRSYSKNKAYDILANTASDKSLKEYISEQINLAFDSPKDKLTAFFLLDALQPSGYLGITTVEAASILQCDEEVVLRVLKKLQTFDPIGIFARNLKECLLIQAHELKEDNAALIAVIQNIDLLAASDLPKLAKRCKISLSSISNVMKQIRALNPKPANGFFVEPISYKIPDVILTFDEQERAKLEINTESIPKLRINNEYYTFVQNNLTHQTDREFVNHEITNANTIVKSLAHRSNTILQVALAIVTEQMDFFTKGIIHLKPMSMSKIATLTRFNESTISRATANKYIATPRGTYELKYFFSSGIKPIRYTNENISSTKVKELIRQIITDEDMNNALSDDDITDALVKFNIRIARRTVTKYRKFLNISTASERKRNRRLAQQVRI